MRSRLKTTFLTTCVLVAGTSHALANGFVLFDHGARATGRGNAVTASIDDGSAIVHNPAGIAISSGTQVMIGASLILPNGGFTPEGTDEVVKTTSPRAVTPHLYLTTKPLDMVAFGFGVHTPFGSRITWPANSPSADEVRSQQLRTVFLTPTVGFDLGRWVKGLRIGGGVDLVPADVELTQDIFFGSTVGQARLGGTALGVGGRGGLIYQPHERVSLGVSYRSRVTLDFTGNGDFDVDPPYRASLPPDGEIATTITLPSQFSGGVAVNATKQLQVEANAVWTEWSTVDKIEIDLPDGNKLTSPRDYVDKVTFRAGLEYKLSQQDVSIRAGYMYDPTPVPTTRLTAALPDINRHDITAGVSFRQGGYQLDLGTLIVLPGSRKTSPLPNEPKYKGTYDVSALVMSTTLSKRF